MTLRHIIYDIREKLKLSTDDMNFSDEYLAHLVNMKRAFLIKQRYGKLSKTIPEELKQTLCVTVETFEDEDGCFHNTLRSTVTIPSFIEVYNKESLLDILLPNMSLVPFNIVSPQRIPFLGYDKWTKNQLYVTYTDSKLYLYSNNTAFELLESIKVVGMFSDPEEANELACNPSIDENETPCDYFDGKYSITTPMITDIVNLVMKELAPTIQIPEDKLNNANETPRA